MSDGYESGTSVSRIIGIVVVALVVLLAIGWFTQGNDFFMFKIFGARHEQLRRETFEKSKAFNQGMIQELQNMQFQYVQADAEHKAALADIILHRAADFDLQQPQVPADLRSFIEQLKRERSTAK